MTRNIWCVVYSIASLALLISLLVCPIVSRSAEPSPSATSSTTPILNRSRAELEIRLREATSNVRDAELAQSEAETLIDHILKVKQKLDTLDLNAPVTGRFAALDDAFQTFIKSWKTKDDGIRAGLDLARFYSLLADLDNAVANITQPIINEVRPAPASKLPPELISYINQLFPFVAGPRAILEKLPTVYQIFRTASPASSQNILTQTPIPLPSDIMADGATPLPVLDAQKEIAQNLKSIALQIATDARNDASNKLGMLEKEVRSQLEELKRSLDKQSRQEDELDSALKAKEDSAAALQNQVSGYLQPIFWGIMLTIVAVLVILRWKSDAQSMLMVRERTVVEMLAIGMFLITVLFLGAGNFIEHATLGTLLGTLAGYLFTRRSISGNTDGITTTSAAEAPNKPAAPSIDPSTKKFKVVLPKGADYVAVFGRDVATRKERFIGIAEAGEFDLSSKGFTDDSQYEIWLVARNAAGESEPSQVRVVNF